MRPREPPGHGTPRPPPPAAPGPHRDTRPAPRVPAADSRRGYRAPAPGRRRLPGPGRPALAGHSPPGTAPAVDARGPDAGARRRRASTPHGPDHDGSLVVVPRRRRPRRRRRDAASSRRGSNVGDDGLRRGPRPGPQPPWRRRSTEARSTTCRASPPRAETQTTVGDAGLSSGTPGHHDRLRHLHGSRERGGVLLRGRRQADGGATRPARSPSPPPTPGSGSRSPPATLPYPSVYVAVTTRSALKSNIAFTPRQEIGDLQAGRVPGARDHGPDDQRGRERPAPDGPRAPPTSTSRRRDPIFPCSTPRTARSTRSTSNLVMTFSRWGEHVTVTRSARSGHATPRWGSGNGTTPSTGPPVLTSTVRPTLSLLTQV